MSKKDNQEENLKVDTSSQQEVGEGQDAAEVEEKNCGDVSDENVELLQKYDDLNERYLRLSAEYDNYRKRTLKEKMDLIKSGGADVLQNILPTIDNFERALKSLGESSDLEAVKEGIMLIYNTFKEFLKQRGVEEISALGLVLDTDLHEAVAQMPTELEEDKGKIIDVVEKGYKINDKVLRFSKVVVAK